MQTQTELRQTITATIIEALKNGRLPPEKQAVTAAEIDQIGAALGLEEIKGVRTL